QARTSAPVSTIVRDGVATPIHIVIADADSAARERAAARRDLALQRLGESRGIADLPTYVRFLETQAATIERDSHSVENEHNDGVVERMRSRLSGLVTDLHDTLGVNVIDLRDGFAAKTAEQAMPTPVNQANLGRGISQFN